MDAPGNRFYRSLFSHRFFDGVFIVFASFLDDLFDDFPMFFASLVRDIFPCFFKFPESIFEPCEL